MEVVLANLAKQIPQEILDALQAGDVKIDSQSNNQERTASILRCIDYSHSNLSPEAQHLLLCLAPFTSVFWTEENILNSYIKKLRQQPILANLPFDRWSEVLREAQNWGLLSPHEVSGYLHMQPTLAYFLRNRLNESGQSEVRGAIETAFREHYDEIGPVLRQLLDSKEPQERQIGQLLIGLEYENLVTALNLALEAQVSIVKLHYALSKYLDAIQDQRRGVELGQTVLGGMKAYSPEKLNGWLGIEFAGAIDEIARRQLNLKQYKEAEVSYQRALSLLLGNKSYDSDSIKKFSASIYHSLGNIAHGQRQWQQAEQYYRQALQIYIEYNDRYSQASTYHQLGSVAQEQRQWQQAEQYYQQALQIKIEFNDRYSQASTYGQLGLLAQEQQQWQQAGEYLLQALQIFAEYKDNYNAGITLRNLARLWKDSDDVIVRASIAKALGKSVEEAEKMLLEALEEWEEKQTADEEKKE